jgi:hypothetical protein
MSAEGWSRRKYRKLIFVSNQVLCQHMAKGTGERRSLSHPGERQRHAQSGQWMSRLRLQQNISWMKTHQNEERKTKTRTSMYNNPHRSSQYAPTTWPITWDLARLTDCDVIFNVSNLLTPLITKCYPVYLKIQSVTRSKHLPSRLQKPITEWRIGQNSLFFLIYV